MKIKTKSFTRRALSLAVIVFTFLIVLTVSSGLAQEVDSRWSEPFNLSNSGGATDPYIITDAFNRIHVFWQDDFDGLVYTQGSDVGWTSPSQTPLPFSAGFDTASLQLVADTQGQVHAAWLDEEGTLFYSRVNGKDFGSPGSWRTPNVIALSTADFAITASPDGKTHIAFTRSVDDPDFPSGIYSRVNFGSSDIWSTPKLVYPSPYFRGIDPGEAQLSLAADNAGRVYLAWDETPQERVYLAISQDGGNIWSSPQEIDRRQPSDGGSSGPSQPVLLVRNQEEDENTTVMITWQAGHQGTNCAQHYRISQDNGASWGDPLRVPEPFNQSCPLRLQSMQSDNGTWLALTNQNGLYVTAWNPDNLGEDQWSTPSLQTALNGFTHPETFRPVSLACRAITLSEEQFHTVSCENDKNGDIWYFTRASGETTAWFPQPTPTPLWSTPAPVSTSPESLSLPSLVTDPLGRLHAFWTQENSSNIYYALWDGNTWTAQIPVINSPGGTPKNPSAVLHPTGAIMLSWNDTSSEIVYFSQAPYSQALSANAWDTPQPVPLGGLNAADPQLAVSADGLVYLAYAVPLNEGRGIYVQSGSNQNQAGQPVIWSEPMQVFDAVQAGWSSLSDPKMAVTPQGQIHLLWTRRSLPPEFAPTGLYGSYSLVRTASETSESGATVPILDWTQPEEVIRGPLQWSSLLFTTPPDNLHRVWQQSTAGQPVLLHSTSIDSGVSWSDTSRITGLENTYGPAGISGSISGDMDLVQITERIAPGSLPGWEMVRWHWNSATGWKKAESQDVPDLLVPTAVALSSDQQSNIAALFTGLGSAVTPDTPLDGSGTALVTPQPPNAILYMGRTVKLIEPPGQTGGEASGEGETPTEGEDVEPAPENTETGDSVSAPGQEGTSPETPTATPPPTFTQQSPGFLQSLFANSFSGIAVGILPAILVLVIIFAVAARRIYVKK